MNSSNTVASASPRAFELVALSLTLILVAGCGTTVQYVPTNASPVALEPRSPEQVQVFTSGPPAAPFVEVGIIQARQSTTLSVHEMPEIIAEMRKDAGKRGCHGLVITGANNTVSGGSGSATGAVFGDSSVDTKEGFSGACIVFTGEPAPAPAAAPVANGCVPNEARLCYGPAGCRGGQYCLPDGDAYSTCDCGDPAPAGPSPPPAGAE